MCCEILVVMIIELASVLRSKCYNLDEEELEFELLLRLIPSLYFINPKYSAFSGTIAV